MKRLIIFLTLIIISIQFISAGGVGISPAFYKEFFEPNLTKSFSFHAFNADPTKGVNTYVRGDLAEYVNLSTDYMLGGGRFTATINLPDKIDKPGKHIILIGVIEAIEDIKGTVGGIAAIQGRIDIIVPYPGQYAESTFAITNINEGEEAKYEITTENLGTQTLKINPIIEIFKDNMTERILIETFKESTLEPKGTLKIQGALNTKGLPPGEYQAVATVNWGKNDTMKQVFRVGEFLVEIIDYDYQFEQGRINPFNIQIQNKWNTRIDEVFASVSITDEGRLVGSFKTVSVDTSPWEMKNITGYFDTTNLEAKRYVAKILLSYGEGTTSKLVAIYINQSLKTVYVKYIIIASIIVIIIIATFVYLILKIRKLKRRNGKKK